MKKFEKFDLLLSPLENTTLIEASAGTGKTYAIAGIFLRLLLEKRLPVDKILVVTYTVAATEELRNRIRRLIRDAIDAFTKGESHDPFLNRLVKNPSKIPVFRSAEIEREGVKKGGAETDTSYEIIRTLRTALRDFDEASIYTIHGFCQRILREYAFESMGLFDTDLLPDERGLREEIVRDYWRHRFYEAPLEFVSYALVKGYRPQRFLDLIRGRLSHPEMRILPSLSEVTFNALEPFRKARESVRSEWHNVKKDIFIQLQDPRLKKTQYKKPEELVASMDVYLHSGAPLPLFPHFHKFTSSGLSAATRKGESPPYHPFFDLCEELKIRADTLITEIDNHLLFLKTDIFRYVREEIRKRKARLNLRSFDDLINDLREALDRSGDNGLTSILRHRYRAALIDEFQDTDPMQCAIFQRIFGHNNSILFFIGDPKQSIYNFRGADLHAYMRASRHAKTRYTLTHNWRSEPTLIRAINTLFEKPAGDTFLYKEIPFEKAIPGDAIEQNLLTRDGASGHALHVWFVRGERLEAAGAQNNKNLTQKLIATAVAAEISRLLHEGKEKKAMIGSEYLSEKHIAVLVRENREARLVQEELRKLGIPCVLHSTGNLFDTEEAEEIERILTAIADNRSENHIAAALATNILGFSGEDIFAYQTEELSWENWLIRFQEYQSLWERNGFIVMFRSFLSREKVRQRLLALPDGERRLTNVLHLLEVLHTQSTHHKLGINGLVKWLACQRDESTPRLEEHELRLESDAHAVKLVTIHKSKGLEYPVVFCPFNWGGSRTRAEEFTFHDPDEDWRLNLVLAVEMNSRRMWAERELLAENIRLLYVSLTRAKNLCYLVWGPFKDAGTSSLAYVLHAPETSDPDIVGSTEEKFLHMSDSDFERELQGLALKSEGSIAVYDMPAPCAPSYIPAMEEYRELFCRTFSGTIDRDRRIASFSSLTSEQIDVRGTTPFNFLEIQDYDGELRSAEKPYAEEATGMFSFPRGAKAGNFFHDVLQHCDFEHHDSSETKKLITETLTKHGFDVKWRDTVCRIISNVATAPLISGTMAPRLHIIPEENRLSEFGFYFPLKRLTPAVLETTFKKINLPFQADFAENLGKLNFSPARGFMKGYIDLVFCWDGRFFIVDWKSNYLGSSYEDYRKEVLSEVMRDEFYILQYHLYVLAIHQYLKVRLQDYDYERHFGGIFYVFLRGVDPANGFQTGIYQDVPAKKAIDYLCKNLIES